MLIKVLSFIKTSGQKETAGKGISPTFDGLSDILIPILRARNFWMASLIRKMLLSRVNTMHKHQNILSTLDNDLRLIYFYLENKNEFLFRNYDGDDYLQHTNGGPVAVNKNLIQNLSCFHRLFYFVQLRFIKWTKKWVFWLKLLQTLSCVNFIFIRHM